MLNRLLLLIIALLMQACNMQHWCARRYAIQPDSVAYTQSTTFSDTIVPVTLPEAIVSDSINLLPDGGTLTMETPFARSVATVRDGKLIGYLEHKQTPFMLPIRNAIRTTSSHQYRREVVPVVTNRLTRWQQIQISAAWAFLVVILLGGLYIAARGRLQWFGFLRRKRQPP